jgi:hypothetical protein
MILHAASIAALFVDQVSQAPVQIQCVSDTGQDPVWARLLFEAVPSVFALVIAWMAFYWNKNNEHDHWVRDQRKSEWRMLIDSLTSIEEAIPVAFSKELLNLLGKNSSAPDNYLLSVAVYKRQMRTLLFAATTVKTIQLSEKFDNLIEFAKSMKIIKDSAGNFEAFEKVDMDSYHSQFNTLVNLIHEKAVNDLNP